jgi:hypothetical protein
MTASPCAALLLALTTLACSGDNAFGPRPFGDGSLERGPTTDLEADARTFFTDVAFGSEFGTSADVIRKWTISPGVRIIGGTDADEVEIRRVLSDIASLTGLAPVIDTTGINDDIRIFFTPRGNFTQLMAVPAETRGATTANWNAGFELTSAVVAIDSAATGNLRTHLITEELTQAFGLLSDSFRDESSIFFRGASSATRLSALDRRVLELLYLPEVRPGMTRAQIDSLFVAMTP